MSRSRELRAESDEHVIKCMGDVDMGLVTGQGMRVTDADGKEYLDAISAEWVLNLGFRHPEVKQAIIDQLDTIDYVSPVFESEARTSSRRSSPSSCPARSRRCSTGSPGPVRRGRGAPRDARDGRHRLRRARCGLPRAHVRDDRHHLRASRDGRGVEPGPRPLSAAPDARADVQLLPLPLQLEPESCDLACAEYIDSRSGEATPTARPAWSSSRSRRTADGSRADGYLERAHEICQGHDVAADIDEVQGAMPLRPMYATQRTRVEPEIIILGKASAVASRCRRRSDAEHLDLPPGSTASPRSAIRWLRPASLAMIEVMERDDLPANAGAWGRVHRRLAGSVDEADSVTSASRA